MWTSMLVCTDMTEQLGLPRHSSSSQPMSSTSHRRMAARRRWCVTSTRLWWRQPRVIVKADRSAVLEFATRSTCSWELTKAMAFTSACLVDKAEVVLVSLRPNRLSSLASGVRTRPDRTLLPAPWAMARPRMLVTARRLLWELPNLFSMPDTELHQTN